MFRMCTHYHDMLVLHYGDYMTPPPENERVSKHDGSAPPPCEKGGKA